MVVQISESDILIKSLNELHDDSCVPKNVRLKIVTIIHLLKENSEFPIRANKALNELSEIANDVNIQSYTRTQIWNIISMLENL